MERCLFEKLNKMSIEYQLYWMSLTNHVIIPKVESRQTFKDQNLVKQPSFAATPQKNHQPLESLYWKKSMSAFKKFKEKKDKKDRRGELGLDCPEHAEPTQPRPFVKLVKNLFRPHTLKGQRLQERFLAIFESPNLGYFDPNEAPLFMMNGEEPPIPVPNIQKKIVARSQISVPQMSEVKIQSIQSECFEDEIPILLALQPLPGDPFIIVRKNSKKSLKSVKSKYIKKQKIDKAKLRDSLLESGSIFKEKNRQPLVIQHIKDSQGNDKQSNYDKCNKYRQMASLQDLIRPAEQIQEQNLQQKDLGLEIGINKSVFSKKQND